MKTYFKFSTVLISIVVSFASFAQSSIQCRLNEDGIYKAELIWQNTLGVAKADQICQNFAKVQSHKESASFPMGADVYNTNVKGGKPPVVSLSTAQKDSGLQAQPKESSAGVDPDYVALW